MWSGSCVAYHVYFITCKKNRTWNSPTIVSHVLLFLMANDVTKHGKSRKCKGTEQVKIVLVITW